MKVLLDRKWKKQTYTIGRVYIDGVFFSNSMEDKDRGLSQDMSLLDILALKQKSLTAIPTGTYTVMMTYSPKYQRMMPQVMDVPGFDGIRFHSFNTAEDSDGCIGLGMNDKPGWISNSRKTHTEFEKRLRDAGGTCKLTIV